MTNPFWRNVLAIITGNIGVIFLIISVSYMPIGYGILAFTYGLAIVVLSTIEICINMSES